MQVQLTLNFPTFCFKQVSSFGENFRTFCSYGLPLSLEKMSLSHCSCCWKENGGLCSSQLASPSVEPPPCNPTGARVIKAPVFSACFTWGRPSPSEWGLGRERSPQSYVLTRNLALQPGIVGNKKKKNVGSLPFLVGSLIPQLGAERKGRTIFLPISALDGASIKPHWGRERGEKRDSHCSRAIESHCSFGV